MPEAPLYEYAIIGAGVSGLTLAWLLADSSLAGRPVLLIDGARDDDELRTLSFWSEGPIALEPLVRHEWSTLRLNAGAQAAGDAPLEGLRYRTLFFADLQREAKAKLARRPANLVINGRLTALTQDDAGATLSVGAQSYRAKWVFDSRLRVAALEVDAARWHLLHQHIHGWVVRAPRDAFEPAVATLLDFRAGDAPAGTSFFYVLPFSKREALVELVTLQPVEAEPLTRAYLARTYGLEEVELLDREAGISPMTEQPFPWRSGPRVRRLGAAAGLLKASTGYALTRILDDCARVVRSLERDGHPFVRPAQSGFYRVLDGVLLELWRTRPEQIPSIFAAMFLRNPAAAVLRFLDERASARDLLRLLFTLPWPPFLRAAFGWLRRRVSASGSR